MGAEEWISVSFKKSLPLVSLPLTPRFQKNNLKA